MTTEGTFPLTPAQRRLWTLAQIRPGDPFFSIPFVITIDGPLDPPALERALDALVRRHEALRTRISRDAEGEPVQAVAPPEPVRLPVADCADPAPAEREERAAQLADRFTRVPFDLEDGPLFRVELLRLDERTHRLLIGVHHIVFDGASMDLCTAELAALYDAFAQGLPEPPAEPAVPYPDFLRRRAERDARNRDTNLRYWTQRLAGAPEVLELPVVRPRPVHSDHEGGRRTTVIPAAVVEPLHQVARSRRSTLFMVLKAACDAVLGQFGGTDVLTGVAISGRDSADSAGVVGYLARPVVLRSDLSDDPAFGELIRRVRDDVLDAHDHADLPFDEVIDALGVARDMSHHPLYQVMYSHQPAPPSHLAAGARFTQGGLRLPSMKGDLSLDTIETDDGLVAVADYRTDLFEPAVVDRVLDRLRTFLERVGADPDIRLSALSEPSDGERRLLTEEWNPDRDAPADGRLVHDLLAEQAARTPDSIAVDAGHDSLTYHALDTLAGQLASRLQGQGQGLAPETRIGVCVSAGPGLVAALLAVLKAGGACVPLDPALPAFRLRLTTDSLGLDTVIADARTTSLLDHNRLRVVELEQAGDVSTDTPPARVHARNAAWILHTSMESRAVVVEHRNLVSRLSWAQRSLPEGSLDALPLRGRLDSHGAVFEILAPLSRGGRVVTGDAGKATALHAAPSELSTLPHVQVALLASGELLTPSAVRDAYAAGAPHVHHLYAAAETAGPVLGGPVASGEPVTLGLPAGCTAYVLDPRGRPVPPGATGELHIGGTAVTRGYAEEPRLTAERFVPDPFAIDPGSRLYATGDLVRHAPDGRLVFAGRAVAQATVRGSRVVFADVEAALLAHPDVARAVVTELPNGDGLAAAVTARPGTGPTESALHAHLLDRLPGYLLPARTAVLDRLPLVPGGRPDTHRIAALLAEPAGPDTGQQPQSETERLVAAAWEAVLGRRVGIGENFFDVGGNSLLLIRLREQLHTALGRQVDVVDLFRHSTVRTMAAFLAGALDADGGTAGAGRRAQARREVLRARTRAHDRRR